jgi:hypothetical protein
MSPEIKEGATKILGSPPKSPANPLTPPTAGEDETALVNETAATIPAGETISIVSIHCQKLVKLTRDQGPIG